MRFLKIFGLMLALHAVAWIAMHSYLSANPREVLIVVDTSYSMKENFPKVDQWIDDYQTGSRYQSVQIGTDKAALGELSDLSSRDVIFRTSFGKLAEDNLSRLYSTVRADRKLLLTNSPVEPDGWEVVSF